MREGALHCPADAGCSAAKRCPPCPYAHANTSAHACPHPLRRRPQVREVTQQYTNREIRWKGEALMAMQEAAEAYLQGLFEDA